MQNAGTAGVTMITFSAEFCRPSPPDAQLEKVMSLKPAAAPLRNDTQKPAIIQHDPGEPHLARAPHSVSSPRERDDGNGSGSTTAPSPETCVRDPNSTGKHEQVANAMTERDTADAATSSQQPRDLPAKRSLFRNWRNGCVRQSAVAPSVQARENYLHVHVREAESSRGLQSTAWPSGQTPSGQRQPQEAAAAQRNVPMRQEEGGDQSSSRREDTNGIDPREGAHECACVGRPGRPPGEQAWAHGPLTTEASWLPAETAGGRVKAAADSEESEAAGVHEFSGGADSGGR